MLQKDQCDVAYVDLETLFYVPKLLDISTFHILGRGGYGDVVSVTTRNGRKFALKSCDPEKFPQFVLRELTFMVSINHRNVMSAEHIYGVDPGNNEKFMTYIVMTQVDMDLSKFIHGGGEYSQSDTHDETSFIIYQICCAVNHLKRLEIIHRDLKPLNVGVTRHILKNANGADVYKLHIQLLDFGMARMKGERDKLMTGGVVTAYYRAPEAFLSPGEYEYGSDVWSVGCIFAELVKKKVLFQYPEGNEVTAQDAFTYMVNIIGSPDIAYATKLFASNIIIDQKSPTLKITSADFQAGLTPAADDAAASNAQDLMNKMLEYNDRRRITAEDALKHKYLQTHGNEADVHAPNLMKIPRTGGFSISNDTVNRYTQEALEQVKELVETKMVPLLPLVLHQNTAT